METEYDVERYRQIDPRTRFAIWCEGEGWCPSHGHVYTFASMEAAGVTRDRFLKESPHSTYRILPVAAMNTDEAILFLHLVDTDGIDVAVCAIGESISEGQQMREFAERQGWLHSSGGLTLAGATRVAMVNALRVIP